ncbi:carbohydrate porin [Photobacterium sp. BZF1]|uniref:carbohydrate porin n=1 Tax=Photobacterium sp. BZF1 TaxID=1904457 RepID=UPI0016537665|nr:carbohydrate porin [Photobacterium sp. BZF1]MBC7005693.1 carbohydrate porin [Photobacterium sp. BZF1]
MKLSAVTKALAAVGLTVMSIPAVQAEEATMDFEFHGYARAGVFSSASNDFTQVPYAGQKETLGRLGLEADDFWELAFMNRWDWSESDKSVRINARLGQDNPNGNGSNGFANIDGKATGLIEAFVEFDGVTSSGTLWGGQRYYGRDNYIFMTDFFYTDYSGTGVGVQNMELGNGAWDFAYIASNQSETSNDNAKLNEMLHALHVRADYGQWRIEALAKYMADNVNGDEYATSGVEANIAYNPEGFFALGEGFSTVSLQTGMGLGSGAMLGRTFTNYNAFSPGSYAFSGDNQGEMTKVKDDDISVRIQAYGGLFAGDWLFFPAVGYEYTDYDGINTIRSSDGEKDYSYWYAMVRPVYTMPSIDNFVIASEFGYTDSSIADDATYKATIAPTWTVDTGFGPAPEIRLLATYIQGSEGVSGGNPTKDSDVIVGAQIDMWW